MMNTAQATPFGVVVRNFLNAFTPKAPSEADLSFLRNAGRYRNLKNLDNHLLADIGFYREDKMSPEARQELSHLVWARLW